MTEKDFWKIIEGAWSILSKGDTLRNKILGLGNNEGELKELAKILNMIVVDEIESQLNKLSKNDLIAFDEIIEQKLHNLDREEIHNYLGGSDDGFLYRRGFVVGMGQIYYKMIDKDPKRATNDAFYWHYADLSCEKICYLSAVIYREKYGEVIPKTNISRESFSNVKGWPTL